MGVGGRYVAFPFTPVVIVNNAILNILLSPGNSPTHMLQLPKRPRGREPQPRLQCEEEGKRGRHD